MSKAEQIDEDAGWNARMVTITSHPVDEPQVENHLITGRVGKNKNNFVMEVYFGDRKKGVLEFDDIDELIELLAETLEEITEGFAEYSEEVMEWDWLGD